MKQHSVEHQGVNRRRSMEIVRSAVGVAAATLLAAGCGGSSGGDGAEASVPTIDAVTVVTAAPVATVAAVVTEPVEEEAAIDIPEVPCAQYVAESGYPLKPCDSGVLVETLQRDLESLFPSITIDGLFGGETFELIKEYQTSKGLEETGLVSEALATEIASADGLADGSDVGGSETGSEGDSVEGDGGGDGGATTEQACNDLVGDSDHPEFTSTQIEVCSELGIDIVGEA